MTPSANQHGRLSRTYFNIEPYGEVIKFFFVLKCLLNLYQTLVEWSLVGLLSELYLMTPAANQDGRLSRTQFNIGPYGNFIEKSILFEVLTQLIPNFFCLEVLSQFITNFGGMVTSWVPFRILFDDPVRQPIWPPQSNLV